MLRLSMLVVLPTVLLSQAVVVAQNAEEHIKNGKAAFDSVEYKKAVEHFTEAIQADPKNAKAYYHRGLAHFRLLEPKKALADQNEAIRLDPKFIDAYVARSSLHYFANQDKEKALADLKEALRLDPKSAKAVAERAFIYAWSGEHSKAIADYERAITLAPDELTYYLQVAKILASCPDGKVRDGKKALDFANKARKLAVDGDFFVPEALAVSYAELGKFDEAIKWQKKAIENMPEAFQAKKESATRRLKVYEGQKPLRYKEFSEWLF